MCRIEKQELNKPSNNSNNVMVVIKMNTSYLLLYCYLHGVVSKTLEIVSCNPSYCRQCREIFFKKEVHQNICAFKDGVMLTRGGSIAGLWGGA